MKFRSATLLLSAFILLAGCASSGSQRASSARPAAATASGDADRLAAFAVRASAVGNDADQALMLIKRATDAAPDRRDLAWLHLRLCVERIGCEPEPLESHLRKLDRDNGAVWLSVLGRAQARGDTAAAEQVLEAMSRAPRFDLYWTSAMASLTPSVVVPTVAPMPDPSSNLPPRPNVPLTTALNDMTSWLSKAYVPAFQPLLQECMKPQTQNIAAQAQARCLRIAQALQQSDSTLAEGVGLGIAQRLTPTGTAAATSIDKRIETLTYQSETAGAVMQGQLEREKFSAQVLELMKKLPREQDVSVAILRWAGQPLAL
jgi:hypothetical protein